MANTRRGRPLAAPRQAAPASPAATRPREPVSPAPVGPGSPVQYARGVGPARAELLKRLGILTVTDLLYRLPRRVEDRSHLRRIYDLQHGQVETVEATVVQVRQFRPRGRRLVIIKAVLQDGSGILHAVWYNQPYIVRQLPQGARVVLHGRVQRQGGEVQMVAPEFEVIEPGEETLHVGRIVPVYGSTEGLTQRILRTIVSRALDDHAAAPAGVASGAAPRPPRSPRARDVDPAGALSGQHRRLRGGPPAPGVRGAPAVPDPAPAAEGGAGGGAAGRRLRGRPRTRRAVPPQPSVHAHRRAVSRHDRDPARPRPAATR